MKAKKTKAGEIAKVATRALNEARNEILNLVFVIEQRESDHCRTDDPREIAGRTGKAILKIERMLKNGKRRKEKK